MEIKGLSGVVSELRAFGKDIEKRINAETEAIAFQIEEDAKKLAPKNFGKLAQSISHSKVEESHYKVTVNEYYGAYLEFGTGTNNVKVPPGWEDMANSFKGKKSGTFQQFLEAMTIWFKSKGYDTKYVWIACINKINNGSSPKPFLYPAYKKGSRDYVKNLEKLLSKTKKKI